MSKFANGQRWICDAELDLGLGTVMKFDERTVTIVFLASGQTRTYSQQSAPLRRVEFQIGDRIEHHEGWYLTIKSFDATNGLITYYGEDDKKQSRSLAEGELSNHIQLNRPSDRLFSGQIDANKWFALRCQALQHLLTLRSSDLTGLGDARTSLIPHQIYIAHEVAKRFAPRVLLADEVGLGKTIEACMIMAYQLITGRASRVLIIVPEALLHQWLVELLRRFAMTFSIFDDERYSAIVEAGEFSNPFEADQLVLCSMPFLLSNPQRLAEAETANWDLVIFDEAHHLQWSEENVSAEYQAAEKLAKQCKGLLLLTATPEQLGKAGHFARLRLLDPQRFHSYQAFLDEEEHYQSLATAIDALLDKKALDKKQITVLTNWLSGSENQAVITNLSTLLESTDATMEETQAIIDMLLDRHGTGRVLFRNTRHTIKGFPQRTAKLFPLALPKQYEKLYEMSKHLEINTSALCILPERLFSIVTKLKKDIDPDLKSTHWTEFDARIDFIIELLRDLKKEKVLIICASCDTAKELEGIIRKKTGMRISAFHEELSIIERDRAASYFADPEEGAQALVCSEIGSEGRNFQFAHHLVLFDIPMIPDLLEQRIGRLDRIGQTDTIQIHVPFYQNSPMEVLARWYQEGLNAFNQTCQVGEAIFEQTEPLLLELIQDHENQPDSLQALIDTSKTLYEKLNQKLEKGRDRLLELNSFKPKIAKDLIEKLQASQEQNTLVDFMEHVFDIYGVDIEDFKLNSFLIKSSPKTPAGIFQGLDEDGVVITYDRNTALANEDMLFITWNHPFVHDAIEFLLSNETGNTSLVAYKTKQYRPGTLLLHAVFLPETIFPEAHQAGINVNQDSYHYLIDNQLAMLPATAIQNLKHELKEDVDQETSSTIIKSQMAILKKMLKRCEEEANKQLSQGVKNNKQRLQLLVSTELERLKSLKQNNPNIRQEEITYLEELGNLVNSRLDNTNLRLDAVQIIITH